MRQRRWNIWTAGIFLVLSIVLALSSLPFSGALSKIETERSVSGTVLAPVTDNRFTFIGFDNTTSKTIVRTTNTNIGSINNKTTSPITLQIVVNMVNYAGQGNPDFNLTIGSVIWTINKNSAALTKTVTIPAGSTVNVFGNMAANTNHEGSFQIDIQTSAINPSQGSTVYHFLKLNFNKP